MRSHSYDMREEMANLALVGEVSSLILALGISLPSG